MISSFELGLESKNIIRKILLVASRRAVEGHVLNLRSINILRSLVNGGKQNPNYNLQFLDWDKYNHFSEGRSKNKAKLKWKVAYDTVS